MSKLVIYQGVQYNILPFIKGHPGGSAVIDQYLTHKVDITEAFKYFHSD
jgi:cytochrome b involved in lipid metabolism